MARKIRMYSTLPRNEQKRINALMSNAELPLVNINVNMDSKKGALITADDDELLIVFDIINKNMKSFENDDENDDNDDNDEDLEENMMDIEEDIDLDDDE